MNTPPSLPRGDPGCSRCGGDGFLIQPVGSYAQASLCDCVPPCVHCGGSGQRRLQVGDRVRVGRCRCQMLPDRVELFNRAAIPARHARSSFVSFQPQRNPGVQGGYRVCQDWVGGYRLGEENRGLILFGGVGRGKTHLLVSMLRVLIMDHGVEARFVEFSHLLSQLKEGYDAGTGEATTLMPLVRVPVLAIDELGKGRGSDWELGIIDQLVSHRYNALGTILATTNYEPNPATGLNQGNLAQPEHAQSLGDRVGDRVLSRLKEMCAFLRLRGDDFRQVGHL
jgi:DNA replication protein DnaC